MHRRDILALASLPLLAPWRALAGPGAPGTTLFLSAASDPGERHWLRAFTAASGRAEEGFRHRLPGRAHHIAVHEERGLFVVLARQPGTWLILGDLDSGALLAQYEVPEGRHLFGHGIFSADGRHFYTVESDYRNMTGDNGLVAVWAVDEAGGGLMRGAEFRTQGVGPHELLLMPDGETLAVANGGIRTHPDSDREMLNLDTMQPSLVYLSAASGALLERQVLDPRFHQASIRHLDVNAHGQVALAMQYEGLPFDEVPLVALHERGGELRFPAVPLPVQQRMKQYCGSVRFSADGRYFGVSCPRGNMITFWDAREERFLAEVRSRDGCGLCAAGSGFLFTAGTGRIAWHEPASGESGELDWSGEAPLFWDNHLSAAQLSEANSAFAYVASACSGTAAAPCGSRLRARGAR